MNDYHDTKLSQQIAQLAADFFARNALIPGALITITRADVPNLKHANILFSVLPEDREAQALAAAKRARSDFREYVMEHGRFHPIPTFDFNIDIGEKNRQRVDTLTSSKPTEM